MLLNGRQEFHLQIQKLGLILIIEASFHSSLKHLNCGDWRPPKKSKITPYSPHKKPSTAFSCVNSFNIVPQAVLGNSWEIYFKSIDRIFKAHWHNILIGFFPCFYWIVVTMFLGMDLPALDLPDPWDTYAMIGFVAWHVGTDVLLEIHSYCLIRKGTHQQSSCWLLACSEWNQCGWNFRRYSLASNCWKGVTL